MKSVIRRIICLLLFVSGLSFSQGRINTYAQDDALTWLINRTDSIGGYGATGAVAIADSHFNPVW